MKLGELDAGNKMAVAALILLLGSTRDYYRCLSICQSIGKIGVGNQVAIMAVIKLMETTDDNKYLCCKAIKTLGKIGCGNQTATLALEKFLQVNRGDRICFDAAKALLLIDGANGIAKDALVYLLESTDNETNDTAVLLGDIAALLLQAKPGIQQEVISTLKNQIETAWDTYLVYGIGNSLNDFYVVNEVIIGTLASIMENTLDKSTCVNSIDILNKFCSDKSLSKNMRKLMIDSLERFLQKNRGDDICVNAAETLLKVNPSNQIAISNLVELLEINRSYNLRDRASDILLQTDEHYEKAILALHEDEINCLNQEYEYYIPNYYITKLVSNEKAMNKLAVKTLLQKAILREVSYLEIDEKSQYNNNSYNFDDSSLLFVADRLNKILQQENFPQIITALREYLSEKFYVH